MTEFNGYELSRAWFDFCFENPELINPAHTAIYLFAIEHCNRLGWKRKFGFPSQMTMDALGIKKHQTYIKYFNDLVDWGAFLLVQKSRNQYSANIISICAMTKNSKALDKAFISHAAKQTEPNGQSNSSVDKQVNKETNKQITINIDFLEFWDLYNKKVSKVKCEPKWNKLKDEERQKIIDSLPGFLANIKDKQYQPNPETYFNQRRWEDEITAADKIKVDKYGGIDLNDYIIPHKDHFGYSQAVIIEKCKNGEYPKK